MEFFNIFFKYICKLCFAFILTPVVVIFLNYVTNDAIIKMIVSAQNSELYQNYFELKNPCDIEINNENGVVHLKETYFTPSLGSCYVDKLNDAEILEIDINFGGRNTSALVLSREIKENNMDVKIKGECFSACVDVLMHGKERFVCDDAIVGIHQQSAKIDMPLMSAYLQKNQKYGMDKYKAHGIDVDLVLDIINKTPSDEMYELSHEELLKTKIATKIITCNDNSFPV